MHHPGPCCLKCCFLCPPRRQQTRQHWHCCFKCCSFCPPGRQQTLNSVVRLHLRCGQPPPCCNAPSQTQQKEVTPKDDLRNLLIDYNLRLTFSDSACRAGSFASTAGYANISVDVVLCIALGNSSNGAAVSTSTARYASVRNYICHK